MPPSASTERSPVQPVPRVRFAEVAEHHPRREHQPTGFARFCRPYGGGPMRRLEHRRASPSGRPGRRPGRRSARSHVAHDVAVEVRQHQHVELLRDRTSCMQRASMIRSSNATWGTPPPRARDLQEQPVGELHDVGLVAGRNRRRPRRPPARRRTARSAAPEVRDSLHRDASVLADRTSERRQRTRSTPGSPRPHLELDPRVHVLGVLPDTIRSTFS